MPWPALKSKSFDELPALAVRGATLRRALRSITMAWMFGIVWLAGTNGSQIIDFCWMLGFQDIHFGIMTALGNAAVFAQLFSAAFVESTGLRKWTFVYLCLAHRLAYILMALVPIFFNPGPAVWAFLGVCAFSWTLGNLSSPAWNTWMGDMIPRRIRGRYFATRRLWTIPVQVAVVFFLGIIFDRVTVATGDGAHASFATQPVLGYVICVTLAIAGVFGAIDVLLFLPLREIVTGPLTKAAHRDMRPLTQRLSHAAIAPFLMVHEAFQDKVFRQYALYCATLNFGLCIGGSFFWTNALRNIGYSKLGTNILFMVLGALSSMFMAKQWGQLLDRYGRRPVLILGTMGVTSSALGWFFIPQGNLTLAYLIGAVTAMWGGITWGAVELGQVSIMLGFSDSKGRSKLMAATSVISAVGGVLGGLAGGKIAQHFEYLQDQPWHVGPFLWNNYHVTFLASTLFRGLSILWLLGMAEPGASTLGNLLHVMGAGAYKRLIRTFSWPVSMAHNWVGPFNRRPPSGPH